MKGDEIFVQLKPGQKLRVAGYQSSTILIECQEDGNEGNEGCLRIPLEDFSYFFWGDDQPGTGWGGVEISNDETASGRSHLYLCDAR